VLTVLTPGYAEDWTIRVPGSFFSMAGDGQGNTYLLNQQNEIIVIAADKSCKTVKLPRLMESRPEDRFCDLVVADGKVWLCGFPFPVVFEMDLAKLDEYKVIRSSDQEIASLNLLNLHRNGTELLVKDADGYLFVLENNQPLRKMPKNMAMPAGPAGQKYLLPLVLAMGDLPGYAVFNEKKNLVWTAPAKVAGKKLKSVEFLGVDRKGQNIFLTVAGHAELDTEFTLFAVKKGKAVNHRQIKAPIDLEMQHFCRLTPDGSILVAEPAANGKMAVVLRRFDL